MPMPVVYRRAAVSDIEGAFRRYEAERDGLGTQLLDEIERIEAHIRAAPELYQRLSSDIRRAVLRRFPYGMFYLVEAKRIVVLACLDLRRDPETLGEIVGSRAH